MTLFVRLMLVVGLGLGTLTSGVLDWAIQTRPAGAESTLAYRGSGRGPMPTAGAST